MNTMTYPTIPQFQCDDGTVHRHVTNGRKGALCLWSCIVVRTYGQKQRSDRHD